MSLQRLHSFTVAARFCRSLIVLRERQEGLFQAAGRYLKLRNRPVAREQLAQYIFRARRENLEAMLVARNRIDTGYRTQHGLVELGRESNLLRGATRLDLRRRSLGYYAPAIQHHDAIGQRIGLFEVVRRQQDAAALRDE